MLILLAGWDTQPAGVESAWAALCHLLTLCHCTTVLHASPPQSWQWLAWSAGLHHRPGHTTALSRMHDSRTNDKLVLGSTRHPYIQQHGLFWPTKQPNTPALSAPLHLHIRSSLQKTSLYNIIIIISVIIGIQHIKSENYSRILHQ